MALFDRASLVQIPSGYKEGKLYNIKPFDQPFEFERGSAATRVNEDGLIEYVGARETAVNGDFSDGSNGWYLENGWTISNGAANYSSVGTNARLQNTDLPLNTGDYIKLTFEISNASGSGAYIGLYNQDNAPITSADSLTGAYRYYQNGVNTRFLLMNADNSSIRFYGHNTSNDFTIDNISVQVLSNDTPRIDYTNGKSLLLEPQRTNLFTYSEDFKLNSSWGLTSTKIDSETNTSPTLSNNAYEVSVVSNNVNSIFDLGRVVSLNDASEYNFSVYLKGKNNGDEVSLYGQRGSTFRKDVVLTTEWNRYDITFTQVGGDKDVFILCGDYELSQPAQSFYIWGGQIEQGSYATSYIPTNGQTETRLADQLTEGYTTNTGDYWTLFIDYANFQNGGINGDESFRFYDSFGVRIFELWGLGSGFAIRSFSGDSNGNYYIHNQFGLNAKAAIRYDGSEISLFIDGVKQTIDSHSVSETNWAQIDKLWVKAKDNKYELRNMTIFPEALTDTELQELTSNT